MCPKIGGVSDLPPIVRFMISNVLFMSYSTLDKVSKLVPNLEYLFSFNFQLKNAETKFCFLGHLNAIAFLIAKKWGFFQAFKHSVDTNASTNFVFLENSNQKWLRIYNI